MSVEAGVLASLRTSWRASVTSWALFGVLPALLPFVRRAGPPLLVAAALVSLVALLADSATRKLFRAHLKTAPVLIAVAFLCWATATLMWTPWPSRGAMAVASGWLVLASFVALSGHPELEQVASVRRLLAWSVLVGAAIVAIDLSFLHSGRALIHRPAELHRTNMVIVSLVLLFCACWRSDGAGKVVMAGAWAGVLAAVTLGGSESAKLALAAATVAYVAARVLPRQLLAGVVGALLCVVWFGFVWQAPLARELSALAPGLANAGHAGERIEIWTAFSQLAVAGLPWGWGVESVAAAPSLPFFATAPAPIRAGLDWMHPHNAVIQIVAEMGAPGLLLGWAASLTAVWWIKADAALTPPRAALVAAIFTVALVSHGFWQMWFWSAAAVAILALRSARA